MKFILLMIFMLLMLRTTGTEADVPAPAADLPAVGTTHIDNFIQARLANASIARAIARMHRVHDKNILHKVRPDIEILDITGISDVLHIYDNINRKTGMTVGLSCVECPGYNFRKPNALGFCVRIKF